MKLLKNALLCACVVAMCLFACVGYAAFTDLLSVEGNVVADPPKLPDVYITDVTPNQSAGVTVKDTNGTVMFSSVGGSGTASFTVDVINISETIYVFDRVIDGAEVGIDGVYAGNEITYQLHGISRLDEIAPNGGTLSFTVTVNVPEGVTAENYILKFNFIDKFGIPSEDYFPEGMPDDEVSLIQRLSDVLNNKYKTDVVTHSRRYLLEETIKVISWNGYPYVGSMDTDYATQLDNLFGDVLLDTTVSFILKSEDLNGDGYHEIALYSTSDTLDCTDEWAGNGVVCVYVTVFTPVLDEEGSVAGYNMVCESLHGYCSEVRYTETQLIPSFSTDTWMNDIGYWAWTEELGSYVEKVPDDALSNTSDVPFRKDFASYNMYYIYDFWRTAPYGESIRQCLDGKIPYLQSNSIFN